MATDKSAPERITDRFTVTLSVNLRRTFEPAKDYYGNADKPEYTNRDVLNVTFEAFTYEELMRKVALHLEASTPS